MARRKAFTKARRKLFLAKIVETGNVSQAAREIGMNRQYMYVLRDGNEQAGIKPDPGFKAEWEEAEWQHIEDCEEELKRRAYTGVKRLKEKRKVMVDSDGKERIVEITREATTFHSDTLLQFHLMNKHPDYQKSTKVQLSTEDDKPLQFEDKTAWDLSALSYEQLCQLRELQQLAKASASAAARSDETG